MAVDGLLESYSVHGVLTAQLMSILVQSTEEYRLGLLEAGDVKGRIVGRILVDSVVSMK